MKIAIFILEYEAGLARWIEPPVTEDRSKPDSELNPAWNRMLHFWLRAPMPAGD
jgi:hypothetical protein